MKPCGGVECEGFTLIAEKDDGCTIALHHITQTQLAASIASSGKLMAASTIAKALREARKYDLEERNPLKEIMESIMRKD